jgi:hypothetical protein
MTELDTKPYLEYLDKEMAIMGILSAVSVIAPGGILSALLASEKGAAYNLWASSSSFILAGAVLCIVAALYFYKERSTLAWYYGQICLKQALDPGDLTSIQQWLRDADSWETWWPYSCAFTFLVTGFVEYLLASVFFLAPSNWKWLRSSEAFCFVACPLVSVPIALLQWHVLRKYKFTDDYWTVFWSDVFGRRKSERPHDHVFTRLAPSKKHGIGVFAIKAISKGDYIFEPDESPTVFVPSVEIVGLSTEVRRLYKDFCVLKEGIYECPSNFNQLTPSWYLNHSNTPNVAPDASLKFFAIRPIKVGEELTADYRTYSDNESDLSMIEKSD